ncbi:MAG: hypothetical protein ACRDPC_01310 [Solirubrobacteraceae bacterium]
MVWSGGAGAGRSRRRAPDARTSSVATGGDLEYADEVTLGRPLRGRMRL